MGERRGKRPSMEDAHVALESLPPPPSWAGEWPLLSFYAVYDGHGGSEASEFAKAHLHRHLLVHLGEQLRLRAAPAAAAGGRASGAAAAEAPGAPPTAAELAASLRAAFLSTDAQFLETTQSCSGSTAVCALISPTHLLVANAGDSRAYILRDGRPLRMTVDHKPDRSDETARITRAGGWVSNGRVMHTLAVSRALGDRDFKVYANSDSDLPWKESLVTAEPEVRVTRVQEGDELILACDGLWDVLSVEAAFEYLHGKKVRAERAEPEPEPPHPSPRSNH